MRRWLYAALLVTVMIPTAPRLLGLLRRARELRPMSIEQRRERLMPDSYPAIEEIRRKAAPNETTGLIGVSRPSLDQALFVNYYVYPQRTTIFRTRWDYLAAREKPKLLVRLGPTVAITTYGALRADEIESSRVVRDMRLPAGGRTKFGIPIVTSADGPPPVTYTIEGAIASDREAHVTLTLEPANIAKTLTVRGTRTFNDLVYECFGVMEFVAWVHVDSDVPVRAAFWLVNRGAKKAAPIRLMEGALTRPAPFPVRESTANMWLLNPGDDYTRASVGPRNALIPPRSIIGVHATGTVSGSVYAFISAKQPDGNTEFVWPEDLK